MVINPPARFALPAQGKGAGLIFQALRLLFCPNGDTITRITKGITMEWNCAPGEKHTPALSMTE
jgi:hypothetical protein